MKLIAAGVGIVLCSAGLNAQHVKTTTTEKTRFEVKDGRDLKVSGCVQPFEDAGYMLTTMKGTSSTCWSRMRTCRSTPATALK